MRKAYLGFVIVVLFFFSVWLFLPSEKDVINNFTKEFLELDFNGIVINKFKDESQHSYPIVTIRSLTDSTVRNIRTQIN